MKIYVLLAERGTHNGQSGSVNLLNVGWAVTQLRRPLNLPGGTEAPLATGPLVVAVFIEAELAMCNRPLTLEVVLFNEDNQMVEIPGPNGTQVVRLEQPMIVPSPPAVPTGFPGHATAMMDLPAGLPLAPGIYRWQARVNGKAEDDWSAHFFVAGAPAPPVFGFPAEPG